MLLYIYWTIIWPEFIRAIIPTTENTDERNQSVR